MSRFALPGRAVAAAVGASALPALAADPAPGAAGMLQMLPGLAIVLALIAVLAWAARRGGLARPVAGGALKTVAERAVGTRERVVVLEVAGQWLVLGVAPGRVQALAQLPRPEGADSAILATDTSRPAFAAWLERALKK